MTQSLGARTLLNRLRSDKERARMATWRSGYAAVCKTVYPGSIPGVASSRRPIRWRPPVVLNGSLAAVGAADGRGRIRLSNRGRSP
jgi:hypothetical protein